MKCESCNGTGRLYISEGDHTIVVDCPICVGHMGTHKWRGNLKTKQEMMRKKLREEGLIE